MNYTIVMFSSKKETMQFYKIISNYGLYCAIINTPKSLSYSCGLSTKIDTRLIKTSLEIIQKNMFHTFKGIYYIEIINSKEIITKIK